MKTCQMCGGALNANNILGFCQRNKECKKEHDRQRHIKNQDRNNERSRLWSLNHPEKKKEHNTEWSLSHPEKKKEHNLKWYKTHIDLSKENSKKWAAKNPEKRAVWKHRRRARKAGNGGSFTVEEWRARLDEFDHRCAYCGVDGKLTKDHIVSVVNGGSSWIANIVPACKECNFSKGAKDVVAWVQERILNHDLVTAWSTGLRDAITPLACSAPSVEG